MRQALERQDLSPLAANAGMRASFCTRDRAGVERYLSSYNGAEKALARFAVKAAYQGATECGAPSARAICICLLLAP